MVVYVEYVFLDNFIIDYALITLARKSLKLSTQKKWLIMASLLGAIFAVINPLLKLSLLVNFILKIFLGLIMVFVSGTFKNIREYFKCFNLFLFFTFSFGGLVTAVFWGLGLSFNPVNYSHGGEIPLFLILGLVFLSYKLSSKVIRNFYKRRRITNFSLKCAVKIGGKYFVGHGFLDSGNSLIYNKKDSPIVVCSKKFAENLQKQDVLMLSYCDTVKINTVSGEDNLPIYKTEKFLIYFLGKVNIIDNVMIGVANGTISPNGEFDLLLGPSLIEGA